MENTNYIGELLENRTKDMIAKKVTEETLTTMRNNKNVIAKEEGKKISDMEEFIKLVDQLKKDIEVLSDTYEK
ncbi:hypothetical protein [Fusobacterium nucleatum]|uniref:Uncharacterized protein n=1 Tax=Fusobacterium nucleatum TaxID=851 RepID=A0A133P7R5_FUSNU|nr:hypothetical protein [Fusobacterium nucleatum]KXA24575.1 hypothetical protein HMPREF3221_00471 [Fusobacterium nucleatum]